MSFNKELTAKRSSRPLLTAAFFKYNWNLPHMQLIHQFTPKFRKKCFLSPKHVANAKRKWILWEFKLLHIFVTSNIIACCTKTISSILYQLNCQCLFLRRYIFLSKLLLVNFVMFPLFPCWEIFPVKLFLSKNFIRDVPGPFRPFPRQSSAHAF